MYFVNQQCIKYPQLILFVIVARSKRVYKTCMERNQSDHFPCVYYFVIISLAGLLGVRFVLDTDNRCCLVKSVVAAIVATIVVVVIVVIVVIVVVVVVYCLLFYYKY